MDLLDELIRQSEQRPVQIISKLDDGEMTVGQKRNLLLDSAHGEYVCFVDDDDQVSSRYIDLILEAIKDKPDCVGLKLEYWENAIKKGIAIHSVVYNQWATKKDEYDSYIFERTPNHLNPIKRDIALKVRFPEVNHGEDHAWSSEIKPYLNSETMIDPILYYYMYESKK